MRRIEARFAPERDASFPRKQVQEPLLRPFETRLLVPFQGDAKMPINHEFTLALGYMRGEWHDRQRAFFLRAKVAESERENSEKEKSYNSRSTAIR